MPPKTMFEKIWDAHVVHQDPGQDAILYVDLHLVHEVTSPQAFEGLRLSGRGVRRPELTVATVDHSIPTWERSRPTEDPIAAQQIATMQQNAKDYDLPFYDVYSEGQGIVHVIGPQLGYTQPGMLIVCGDSHTSTHGAFGSMGMAIGTTQAEHVLATQCVQQANLQTMELRLTGTLPSGVGAKDIILGIIGEIGIDGARGYAVEYTGEAIRNLSMEGRMTVCNMSIEAGARIGMVAPDETTFDYVKGRRFAPKGEAWEEAVERWRRLPTDAEAKYDRLVEIDAGSMEPYVTWGTNPGMVAKVSGKVPDPAGMESGAEKEATERALQYMGLEAGKAIEDIRIDRAFIGSCTNSRIEDLRVAAGVAKGKKVDPRVYAMVVPGSFVVKRQAEQEGLDQVFKDAGFDWREAGCSMCLGMNPDILQPGERCASTSNRNFEGRQGKGGRTHLVSPAMAAAAAIAGRFVDIRDWS